MYVLFTLLAILMYIKMKKRYSLRKNKYFIISFLLFLLPTCLHAQFSLVLDSIQKLDTPLEKIRYVFGYVEDFTIRDSRSHLALLYNELATIARTQKDAVFSEYLEYRREHHLLTRELDSYGKIDITEQQVEKHLKANKLLFAGYDYHFLAQENFMLQRYGYAFENYFSAYELFEKIGFENTPHIDQFLHDFALSNYFFKNYEEVIRLMSISMKYPPCSQIHHIQRYNNIGLSYQKLGFRDSALFYIGKANELSLQYNNVDWQGICAGNIGNIFYGEKDYAKALPYFKQAYSLALNSIHEPIKVSCFLNVAKTLLQIDSIVQCNEYIQLAEHSLNNLIGKRRYGETQELESLKKSFFEVQSLYFMKQNQFEKAYQYKDSFALAQSHLDEQYNAAIVKMTSDKLTIQSAKLALIEKQKQKERQKLIYIILIIFIFCTGVTGYIYMYKLKEKKKFEAEKLLSLNKIIQIEKHQIETDLENAKNDLFSFKQKIAEQNKLIEHFENAPQPTKKEDDSQLNNRNNFLENLKNIRILTDADWINFQKNFELVYPVLSATIARFVPIFTIAEKRYIMLVKLGFSNKEMATALGVSEGAMRITWKRVREKLNIEAHETPTELIQKLENM